MVEGKRDAIGAALRGGGYEVRVISPIVRAMPGLDLPSEPKTHIPHSNHTKDCMPLFSEGICCCGGALVSVEHGRLWHGYREYTQCSVCRKRFPVVVTPTLKARRGLSGKG